VLGYLLSRMVNVETKVLQSDYKEIIPGRGGDIVAGDMAIGIIGEMNPEILDNFGIQNPVAFLEINLDKLSGIAKE